MTEELKSQISRLVALYEAERQRANELAGRLNELEISIADKEEEVRDCRQQITEMNLQIDNLRLMGAFTAGGDMSEARAGLDKLIREIDKCIKLLDS